MSIVNRVRQCVKSQPHVQWIQWELNAAKEGIYMWNPIITVTKGQKEIGRNNEVTVLTRVCLQENVWTFFPGGQNKVTVLRRWQ